MTTNETALDPAVIPAPITVMVSAWEQNRVVPGSDYYLGITITNRGDQDAVVNVRLESSAVMLQQWCPQPEQWLALSCDKGGELTFCIHIPADVLPQWLHYDVVVRPQGAYENYYIAPTPCSLQILAPETAESTQDPTFSLSPLTTPQRPILVQADTPVPVELVIENRSDRVDRFRLDCTGLPADWEIKIDYPRNYTGLGLVEIGDSVGINPGDRGTIQVYLQAPPLPLAGNYLPTFRLRSENDPTLGLLALVYLRVEPVYLLQAQLQVIQDQVRHRPAQFTVQLANQGNTPRQVALNLKSLSQPDDCVYTVSPDQVFIDPQTTALVPLEGKPQHWWTRPWFGGGKVYPFRVDFLDVDRHPITPNTFQGFLTWMPRPWWQLLLAIVLALGAVGTLVFLLWWYLLRPPPPATVLEFAAEDSQYAEVRGDMVRVRWQIENPQQIQRLMLTGYGPEGQILSGPLTYDFQDGQLPAALQPFCTQQQRVLQCSQVRSDAFQPGQYVFELTIVPKRRRAKPVMAKTAAVEVVAKPLPTVTELLPQSLVYREAAPGDPAPQEAAIPIVTKNGITLDWVVTMPDDLVALHLIGRDQDGKMVGDLWFNFPSIGQLPEELEAFCSLEQVLICRNIPTGLTAVGTYRFELAVVAAGQSAPTEAKPKTTEAIKIQPQIPQILSFLINGQEAPAKLLVPFQPGQDIPFIQVSWQVQGGATTQVELTPAPGNVPLVGALNLPLSPQGGVTLALQVKTATGEVITRSVTIEVYNPDPNGTAPGMANPNGTPPNPAATPPGANGSANGSAGASGTPPLNRPAPAVDGQLSPTEQPPQFNP